MAEPKDTTSAKGSLVSRLRHLKSGRLSPDNYARELVRLADLDTLASERGYDEIDKLAAYRLLNRLGRRLDVLERKIGILEAAR